MLNRAGKFRIKDEERELDVGKASAFGYSLVSFRKGVDSKLETKFETEDEGNGIYKVTPAKPLDAGEYAFVITGAEGSARIYDFSIANSAQTTTPPK